MELVHPIWHKTHFKIRWIYIGLVLDLALITIFYGTKNALITKVKGRISINATICQQYTGVNVLKFLEVYFSNYRSFLGIVWFMLSGQVCSSVVSLECI